MIEKNKTVACKTAVCKTVVCKTPKPTKPREKRPKPETWDEYRHMGTWKMTPINIRAKRKLFADLYDWALNDPDALVLKIFYLTRGISKAHYYRWLEEPEFLAIHKTALALIGVRRENGAITKKYDLAAVKITQPHYCDEAREMEKWRARLKAESDKNSKPTEITVSMDDFSKLINKQ